MYESNDNQEMFNSENRLIEHVNEKKIKKGHIFLIVLLAIIIIAFAVLYFGKVPIIKYQGEKVETVEYGETYEDKGIKVYTQFKNISDKVIVENNVNLTQIGDYTITYKVPYFNKYKNYTRTVKVIDTKAPEIQLKGDTEYNLQYGKKFEEPGFTAIDNKDGDVTEKVTVNKVEKDSNNFEEHYTVTDSSGNKAETVRYVKIIDTTAPVIKLKGASVVSIITGNKYTEQGATATDNKDGDVSKDIKISGDVDTSKDGTYIVKYTVTDSNGNTATEERKVIVSEKATTGIIYLTFDDGPSTTITPKILDVLKEKGVHATFFVINYNEATEHLVKREAEEGHAIGIHGYSHDYSKIYASVDVCYNNIKTLQEKIYKTTGIKTMILRFPGGSSNTVSRKYCPGIMTKITEKVLSEGFKYYDWNVMSGDSGDVKTKEAVYANVTKGLKPGRDNIVLMHDFSGNNKTLEALPGIIDYGLANGYKFEVITPNTEMVRQKIQN